jgi:predicted DNA-binding WGR domain protein
MCEDTEQSFVLRFEKAAAQRFYELRVQRDLFGDHELWQVWGSTVSRCGNSLVRPMRSLVEAREAVTREARRRQTRGYVLVEQRGAAIVGAIYGP